MARPIIGSYTPRYYPGGDFSGNAKSSLLNVWKLDSKLVDQSNEKFFQVKCERFSHINQHKNFFAIDASQKCIHRDGVYFFA